MTDIEKFIKASMFVIPEMRRMGSYSVALERHSENPKKALWEDVELGKPKKKVKTAKGK